VEADLFALEWSVLRILAQDSYRYDMNAVVSALKIRGSEMQAARDGIADRRVGSIVAAALHARTMRISISGDLYG